MYGTPSVWYDNWLGKSLIMSEVLWNASYEEFRLPSQENILKYIPFFYQVPMFWELQTKRIKKFVLARRGDKKGLFGVLFYLLKKELCLINDLGCSLGLDGYRKWFHLQNERRSIFKTLTLNCYSLSR